MNQNHLNDDNLTDLYHVVQLEYGGPQIDYNLRILSSHYKSDDAAKVCRPDYDARIWSKHKRNYIVQFGASISCDPNGYIPLGDRDFELWGS